MDNFFLTNTINSLVSPKVGAGPSRECHLNFWDGIRQLCSLPLTTNKTLIVFAEVSTLQVFFMSYPSLDYVEKSIKYYGKILDMESLDGDISSSTFLIDQCTYTLPENSSDDILTFAIKAQLVEGDKFLITWLKAEVEESL